MHNGLKFTFTFTTGAAVGAAVSWFVLKTRYEQLAQEDARSVREEYLKKYGTPESDTDDEENEYARWAEENPSEAELDKEEYNELAGLYSNNLEKGGSDSMSINKPRVILPREFEEDPDYDVINLNYYADGVLADDMDEIVEDIEHTVGDFKEHFGEYENDTVYVRNDELRCYYEICADDRNYYDVAATDQDLVDEE
jgi:hypothetical protein